MKLLRFIISTSVIIIVSAFVFAPFTILITSLPDEAWLVNAAREMHLNFSMIPSLDGFRLDSQNPLVVMLYALTGGDLLVSRYFSLALGVIMALSVFFFASYIWNTKTGFLASILTVTSLGTLSLFGKVYPGGFPVLMSSAGLMLFSAVYLKNLNRTLYLISYIMATFSILTGGPVFMFFFVFSALMLILLDLSPRELLKIRPLAAVLLLFGGLLAVYTVFIIAGGKAFISNALSQGNDLGFFKSLWLIITSTMPWTLFIIPAWIYSARPSEFDSWRELLPAKIAFISCFLIAWLSGKCPEAFCALAAPFGSMLIACWAVKSLKETSSASKTVYTAALSTTVIIILIPVAYIFKFPLKSLHLNIADGMIALCLLLITACLCYASLKRRFDIVFIAGFAAMLFISWLNPIYDVRLNNPDRMIAYCSRHYPLVVYEDDLIMRGKLSGINPAVVPRCFIPVEEEVYIAVSDKNTRKLIDMMSEKMSADLKIREVLDREYALIKVGPKNITPK